MVLRPYLLADRDACLALFDSNVPAFFAPYEREGFASFIDDLEKFSARYFILVEGERTIACGGVGRHEDEDEASPRDPTRMKWRAALEFSEMRA